MNQDQLNRYFDEVCMSFMIHGTLQNQPLDIFVKYCLLDYLKDKMGSRE